MKTKKIIYSVLLLIIFTSCKKDTVSLYPKGYSYVDFGYIDLPFTQDSEYVIKDSLTYRTVFQPIMNSDSIFTLPPIDFSQKTLLGKYTAGGGCEINFIKQVCVNRESKKYIYYIFVVEKGECFIFGYNMNWITIPKVPDEYNITFDVEYR